MTVPALDDAFLPEGSTLGRPTEADQPAIVNAVDQWFGTRRPIPLLARGSFRAFSGTSWLIKDPAGAPIGYLLGYRSPSRPDEAVLQVIAVDPNHRRRGIGRFLVAAFEAEARAFEESVARAVAWPDEPTVVAFFRGVGWEPEAGPGSQNLWGIPAWPDYDGHGEDRVIFVKDLATA